MSYAIANYDVDPDRVYLTGLSCGATGAWEYVAEYGGSQIAAMVPIAGEGRPAWEAAECSLGEVAIWAFHGDADDVVAPAGSIDTITKLTGCPQPRSDAELTVYPGVDHDSWTAPTTSAPDTTSTTGCSDTPCPDGDQRSLARLRGMTVTEAAPTRWTAQWKELFEEVITTGLCTGCAGCVVTCPHDVIGYEHAEGE